MKDASHLIALQTRLAVAKKTKEIELRKVWIVQIEKEIAHEKAFIGFEDLSPEITDLSDDDLLAELLG
jgi:hypothetical protein